MQGSAGQKRVPTDYLRKYKFFIPKGREEQVQVAEALEGSDLLLKSLRNDLRLLREQKKALMHQLLIGKRRVKFDSAA